MLSAGKASNASSLFSLRVYQPTALDRNLVLSCLYNLSLGEHVTLACYMDYIMLIGLSEQTVEITLDLLVRCLYVRKQEINLTKIQGCSTSEICRGEVVWGMSRNSF